MYSKLQIKNLVWVDLESPSQDELKTVMREFNIDPLVAQELLEPSLKPRTEDYKDFLYLALHFPSIRDGKMLSEQEIDFVLGKNFLITARYQAIPAIEELKKTVEKEAHLSAASSRELNHDVVATHYAADILLNLLQKMYTVVEKQIEDVEDDLEEIEEEIFNENEKEMVFALSYAGRDILNLKQALDPHQEILRSLAQLIEKYSSESQKMKLKSIEDIYYKLRKKTNQLWHSLSELRETNNSLLSTKQNEVMKIFTILAFVTFPLSLVSSIFGMNTEYMPVQGRHLDLGFVVIPDFWLVIAMMTLATILMFVYFKKKKWM